MVDREKAIYRITIQGSIVNIILTIGKLIAGFLGNSSAMIADGVHSASDLLTDLVLIVFVKISSKPSDEDHSYGHGKYETLGTVIIGLALFAVAIEILISAIDSIRSYIDIGSINQPAPIALIAAVVSIVFKEALYRYTVIIGKKFNSPSVIANAWHHRSDAFSSIGTLIGISCAYFLGGSWTIMDPIAALVVVVLIMRVSYELIVPGLEELLDRSLPDETQKEIEEIVMNREEVNDIHHLKTRRLGPQIAIEFHLRVDGHMSINSAHDITLAIEKDLRHRFGSSTQIIIHMEPKKD